MDVGSVSRSFRQACIARDKRSAERLAQRRECGVIGGEVVSQFPHPVGERLVRIPRYDHVGEIGSAVLSPLLAEIPLQGEPAKGMDQLDIE